MTPLRLSLLLVTATIGCGSGNQASLTGAVTLDGKPLTLGTVTFAPVQDGPMAFGNIQPDGSYTAATGDQQGLNAGEYRVTVVAQEMPPVTPENTEPLPKLLTPAKYADRSTSGLTVDVKPGANRFDIALTAD